MKKLVIILMVSLLFVPNAHAIWGWQRDDDAMPSTPMTTPVSGEYRSSATTYTSGDVTVLQTDVNGYLIESSAVSTLAELVKLYAAMDAELLAIQTAVELLDNAIDGNYYNTNMNIAGSDVSNTVPVPVEPDDKTGVVVTADTVIKASAGTVYALVTSADGVTAGDKIEIENAVADGGTSLLTIVFQAADQVLTFCPAAAITYATGIYYDVTISGGAVTTTIVYE